MTVDTVCVVQTTRTGGTRLTIAGRIARAQAAAGGAIGVGGTRREVADAAHHVAQVALARDVAIDRREAAALGVARQIAGWKWFTAAAHRSAGAGTSAARIARLERGATHEQRRRHRGPRCSCAGHTAIAQRIDPDRTRIAAADAVVVVIPAGGGTRRVDAQAAQPNQTRTTGTRDRAPHRH